MESPIRCPDCAEPIEAAARKCKHCHSWVSGRGDRSVTRLGPRFDGAVLVLPGTSRLPAHRCVRCGEPADGRPVRLRPRWHPRALYLLLPLLLPYLVASLFLTRRRVLDAGLCHRHRRRRRLEVAGGLALAGAWVGGLVLFCAFGAELGLDVVVSFCSGVLVTVAALISFYLLDLSYEIVRPTRIDADASRLLGVHPRCLEP